MKTTKFNAQDIADKLNCRLFGQRSSSSQSVLAELELDGRSHYYAPNTRRYFNCRVLDCVPVFNGLILGTVESICPPNNKRLYRAVFFNLLGDVIYRTEHKTNDLTGWATTKSARKEFKAFVSSMDASKIGEETIAKHRKQLERQLNQLDN